MGWELRKGRPYYFRKVRQGKTVVSIYAGGGPAGETAAAQDRERRAARARLGATRRLERDRLAVEDKAIDTWFRDVEVLAHAALLAAGYHRHARGEWRRSGRISGI